jgi:hypothetical protein
MKITLGETTYSFGPLGRILLGVGLVVLAASLLLPFDISKGVEFVYLLLTGIFLVIGV